jgi:Domain of unknown function (DUF6916)
MEKARRKFIVSAGTLGLASMVLPTRLLSQVTATTPDEYGRAEFEARVDDWFYLSSEDDAHQCNLRLVSVEERGTSFEVQQFALMFASQPGAEAMPSGYYQVAGEPFNLFIKHVEAVLDTQIYSADFALLQPFPGVGPGC